MKCCVSCLENSMLLARCMISLLGVWYPCFSSPLIKLPLPGNPPLQFTSPLRDYKVPSRVPMNEKDREASDVRTPRWVSCRTPGKDNSWLLFILHLISSDHSTTFEMKYPVAGRNQWISSYFQAFIPRRWKYEHSGGEWVKYAVFIFSSLACLQATCSRL